MSNSINPYISKILYLPLLLLFVVIGLNACKQEKTVEQPIVPPENEVIKETLPIDQDENKDRDVWQKPSIVLDQLGDISDKIVADIGAGTGYFTFRLALNAKKVIAIDIESKFLEIINTFKRNLPGEFQDKIETRLARYDNPLIKNEEVDLIVIINTIGYIQGRKKYLKTLLPGLKKGGQLVIIDYKMKNLPLEDAPPQEDRVPLSVIENELAASGYSNIQSNDTSLDHQYIIFADKPD